MHKSQMTKALTEIDEIFKYAIPEEQLQKLPQKFLQFVKEKKDVHYQFKYDETKEFDEQKLLHETKLLLSALYLNYWASNEEKKEISKILNDNEKKYVEENAVIPNSDLASNTNMVNNNVPQSLNVEVNLPQKYKVSIFQKIFNAIKNIRIFK